MAVGPAPQEPRSPRPAQHRRFPAPRCPGHPAAGKASALDLCVLPSGPSGPAPVQGVPPEVLSMCTCAALQPLRTHSVEPCLLLSQRPQPPGAIWPPLPWSTLPASHTASSTWAALARSQCERPAPRAQGCSELSQPLGPRRETCTQGVLLPRASTLSGPAEPPAAQ